MKRVLVILILLFTVFQNVEAQRIGFFLQSNSASYDPAAQAFFTAAGITDNTQKSAVNTLVVSLKSNSFWTRFKFIYPFVGGTATTHKYNLKDPQDADGAFRLTFGGTITHSSSGADPNGSTGYGDTHLVPGTDFSDNIICIGVYLTETSAAGDKQEMGVAGDNGFETGFETRVSGDLFYPVLGNSNFPNASNSAAGFFCANRQNTSNVEGYKNGSRVVNSTQGNGRATTNSLQLFCRGGSFSTRDRYSDRNTAFAFAATGFTESELATLNTIVEAFEDALGRGVQ